MTEAQRLRTIGFNASLKTRGVSVVLYPGGEIFIALVEPVQPASEQYPLSNETRNYSKIHLLRSSLAPATVHVGSVLQSDDGATSHRVTRIEDNPQDIAIHFYCETAPSE